MLHWFYFKMLTEEQKEKYAEMARQRKAKKSDVATKEVNEWIWNRENQFYIFRGKLVII